MSLTNLKPPRRRSLAQRRQEKKHEEKKMNSYRVTWEIDIDAVDPLDAARQARAHQVREGTSAKVFDVIDEDGGITRIDLFEIDDQHFPCAEPFNSAHQDETAD
jgi:hypothetical protein